MVEIFGFSRPSMVRNAALREVFVQICVRKTVGLFELAGLPCKVLTEAWLLQGPPKAATEAAPTGQAGCVEPFLEVHLLRHLPDTKQQRWEDFGTEPD